MLSAFIYGFKARNNQLKLVRRRKKNDQRKSTFIFGIRQTWKKRMVTTKGKNVVIVFYLAFLCR